MLHIPIRERCIDMNMIFVEFVRASQKYFRIHEQMHMIEEVSGNFPMPKSSPEGLILPTHEFRNCAVSSQLCNVV